MTHVDDKHFAERFISTRIVIAVNFEQVSEFELYDYISEHFDSTDWTSWLGNEVIVSGIVVSDHENEEFPVVLHTEDNKLFAERIIVQVVRRWPWLASSVAGLCDAWTNAIRWSVLKDQIEGGWNEYTDLGFEVSMEDDEADNEIYRLQEEISARINLAIDEAQKIEKELADFELRYESID
jgi:hypothetical protein